MNSLRNRVLLIGRLGAQPETKIFGNGNAVARFSIATSETYKNDKGERVDETQWHNLVAWGKTAEIVARFLNKGKEVAIEGKLVTRHYTDKDGVKHHITEIVVNDMLMIGPKPVEN